MGQFIPSARDAAGILPPNGAKLPAVLPMERQRLTAEGKLDAARGVIRGLKPFPAGGDGGGYASGTHRRCRTR